MEVNNEGFVGLLCRMVVTECEQFSLSVVLGGLEFVYVPIGMHGTANVERALQTIVGGAGKHMGRSVTRC